MTWKDVYKKPFVTDDYGIYIFSEYPDGELVTALDLENILGDDTRPLADEICKALNGEIESIDKQVTEERTDKAEFDIERFTTISIRGWGHLTGPRGCTVKQARAIQDEFYKEVINKFKRQ